MITLKNLPYFDISGRQLGEIDKLEIDTGNYVINIYEFKARKTRKTINKAYEQLSRANKLFKEIAPEYRINTYLMFKGNDNGR